MTSEAPALREAEVAETKATFLSELTDLAPGLAEAGLDLFARICTPNWALEWGLSDWLGTMLGWPAEKERELRLSNLYMLAFARLTDDLADGENPSQPGTAAVLAATLHHLCFRSYIRLFDGSHLPEPAGDRRSRRFRTYFDTYMAQWLHATVNPSSKPGPGFRSLTESDLLALAERGALLKVPCAAACVLSGCEDKIAPLGVALDELLVGIVLLDDEFDWAQDIEAGRHNAFVAYCSHRPQTMEHRQANRRAVLKQIYLAEAAGPYFDLICDCLDHAARSAQAAACPGMYNFVTWYSKEVKECGRWLAEEAEAKMRLVIAPFLKKWAMDHEAGARGLGTAQPGA